MQTPEAKAAREPACLSLIKHALVQECVVPEACSNLAGDGIDFRVAIVVVLDGKSPGVDECAGLAKATTQLDAVASWIEFDDLRIRFVWIDRDAVASLVEVVIETEERLFRIETKSRGRAGFSRKRILDTSDWRVVVAGPLPAEINQTSVIEAGILAGARESGWARSLIQHLTTSESARVFQAKGLTPPAAR